DLQPALALYEQAALDPSVRAIALYRGARAAGRLSQYAREVELFGTLLSSVIPGVLRATALHLLALDVLANDDLDGDLHRDPGFPVARLAMLPDAPWARWAAIAGLHELAQQARAEDAEAMRAAMVQRWPDIDAHAIDAAMQVPTETDGEVDDVGVR